MLQKIESVLVVDHAGEMVEHRLPNHRLDGFRRRVVQRPQRDHAVAIPRERDGLGRQGFLQLDREIGGEMIETAIQHVHAQLVHGELHFVAFHRGENRLLRVRTTHMLHDVLDHVGSRFVWE